MPKDITFNIYRSPTYAGAAYTELMRQMGEEMARALGVNMDPWGTATPEQVKSIRDAVADWKRPTREERRCEIDRVLAEDARRFPAFATARRCAVMAICEGAPPHAPDDMIDLRMVRDVLTSLRSYEDARGVGRQAPHPRDLNVSGPWLDCHGDPCAAIVAYERARHL